MAMPIPAPLPSSHAQLPAVAAIEKRPCKRGSFCPLAHVVVMVLALGATRVAADELVLRVEDPSPDGLVIAEIDLTPALRACGTTISDWRAFRAVTENGDEIPFQFIPNVDFDPSSRFVGLALLRLPNPNISRVRLKTGSAPTVVEPWDGTVQLGQILVRHDLKRLAGFPGEVVFTATGKVLPLRWADRVYDRDLGSLTLTDDPDSQVERLSEGPLCTVVRTRAKYGATRQPPPPGSPFAVYDWIYFHDRPLIMVRATALQASAFRWSEHHFLELQFHQQNMPHWVTGTPEGHGTFTDKAETQRGKRWAYIHDGQNAVGMLAGGTILVYDSPGEDGNYLQAQGDLAWRAWDTSVIKKSAIIWIGAASEAASALSLNSELWPPKSRVVVSTDELARKLSGLLQQYQRGSSEERAQTWWRLAAGQLEEAGRLAEARAVAEGKHPDNWTEITAGDLGLLVERTAEGMVLLGIWDIAQGRRLTQPRKLSLFELLLATAERSQEEHRRELRLTADEGWGTVAVESGNPPTLVWKSPKSLEGGPLEVRVALRPCPDRSAVECDITVGNVPPPWSLRQVVFPQIGISDLGRRGCVLYPQGSGIVTKDPWSQNFSYQGRYPSGWTTMQFLAVYDEVGERGLYLAVHDPRASTKEISVRTLEDPRCLRLRFEHWVPNMTEPGNAFELSGTAVVQLFRGDWYDASRIYRAWVTQEAQWYPSLGPHGREDTPPWMRELPLWALYGGAADQCAEQTQRFAEAFGVPCGVHWYNWHMNPFDNDYPHYFPTKPEFPGGVQRLRQAGVHVMPYINGRLWDTRDRGLEDWQFTRRALSAATKDENGDPFVETYGSKESDGSPVRLAVMCPTTELWQSTVKEIVLRLFREFQVDAVYIDQIAAAAPTLCCDKNHGHPLGGGHWWTEGYWKLLEAIRREKPADCMLTTECNGEPYIRWMDGYLTWHWQYDGQVPAFPAVYGGAIQMFGRSYGGGPTRDLALRMRAAQQLVYGEQLGWINPGVIQEKDNFAFMKRLAELRWRYREFFSAGWMLRPPRSETPLPIVQADWQWGGTRWVTTEAVLTGAWYHPAQAKAVVFAVNVGDEAVKASFNVDLSETALRDQELQLDPADKASSFVFRKTPKGLSLAVEIPPRTAWAWVITPRG